MAGNVRENEEIKSLVEGQAYPAIRKVGGGFKLLYSSKSAAAGIYMTELQARKKYEQYKNTIEERQKVKKLKDNIK